MPEIIETVELTREEQDVIIAISKRVGCDRDGDILSFFVKEDEGISSLIPRRSMTIPSFEPPRK